MNYENGITIADLNDCLLVNPDISRRGGQSYTRKDEQQLPTVAVGKVKTKWTTEKTIENEVEFKKACQLQSKAKYAFGKLGRHTAGGIVVNRAKRAEVEELTAKWRRRFDEFNASATTVRIECVIWVMDITGDNVKNLQNLIDRLGEYLTDLERAVAGMKPADMRAVLKNMGGFVDLLPETVGMSLEKAIKSARTRANKISRSETRIKNLEAKLAEELGVENEDEVQAAINALMAQPLVDEIAKKAARITKLAEEKQTAVDALEDAKRDVDTSAVRLARFAVLGRQAARGGAQDDDDGSDRSDELLGAQNAARFARMNSAAPPYANAKLSA